MCGEWEGKYSRLEWGCEACVCVWRQRLWSACHPPAPHGVAGAWGVAEGNETQRVYWQAGCVWESLRVFEREGVCYSMLPSCRRDLKVISWVCECAHARSDGEHMLLHWYARALQSVMCLQWVEHVSVCKVTWRVGTTLVHLLKGKGNSDIWPGCVTPK